MDDDLGRRLLDLLGEPACRELLAVLELDEPERAVLIGGLYASVAWTGGGETECQERLSVGPTMPSCGRMGSWFQVGRGSGWTTTRNVGKPPSNA